MIPVSDQNQQIALTASGLHQPVSHRVGPALIVEHPEREQRQDVEVTLLSSPTHSHSVDDDTT